MFRDDSPVRTSALQEAAALGSLGPPDGPRVSAGMGRCPPVSARIGWLPPFVRLRCVCRLSCPVSIWGGVQ